MASLHECSIDRQEVYNTIIPEEDRFVLKRARELGMRSKTYHSSVTFKHETGLYNINLDSIGLVPVPLVEKQQPLLSLPFAEPMIEWGKQMHEVAVKFTLGRELLELLNNLCKSPKQVRYLLPGIVVLLKTAGHEELAAKLGGEKLTRSAPSLPVGVRPYLAEYNALLSKVSLLPKGLEDRSFPADQPRYNNNTELLVPWTERTVSLVIP